MFDVVGRFVSFAGGEMRGLKNVRNRRDDSLSRVAWDQLEALLAIYYRGQGYGVEHCGTGATRQRFDGGIDLKLRKDGEYILVQCKHWNAKQVPHNEVHQLLGIMVNECATGAILVSSGEFTVAARQAADKLGHVSLVDGDALRAMIGPLPEPATVSTVFDDIRLSAPRHIRNAAAAAAAGAGERLLSAAEARIRGGNVVRPVSNFLLYKTLAALLFAGFMLFAALFVLNNLWNAVTRIGQRPAATPSAAPVFVPAPASNRAVTTMPVQVATPRQDVPPLKPYRPPTEAEIRESQRKADEAINVIKDHVPEM
jgi:hypothetical protein